MLTTAAQYHTRLLSKFPGSCCLSPETNFSTRALEAGKSGGCRRDGDKAREQESEAEREKGEAGRKKSKLKSQGRIGAESGKKENETGPIQKVKRMKRKQMRKQERQSTRKRRKDSDKDKGRVEKAKVESEQCAVTE